MFLLFGPLHTEICRHIVNYDNPTSARIVQKFENMYGGQVRLNEEANKSLRFTGLYSSCRNNESTISVFGIDQVFSMSTLLNPDDNNQTSSKKKKTGKLTGELTSREQLNSNKKKFP